jgi:hypothetical protein
VFRWPVEISPLSLGSQGIRRSATLEVTPRGAAFTLAALSHVGHPAHLALIDAYLKGQIRLTQTSSIGEDSRTVAASLLAPLLAAFELGIDRLTLADLILLPRDQETPVDADRAPDGQPTRSPDSSRLLLRAGAECHWVRASERFEASGCLGTRRVGQTEPWHNLVAELPDAEAVTAGALGGRWPAAIVGERRAPSSHVELAISPVIAALRALALARFCRSTPLILRAAEQVAAVEADHDGRALIRRSDVRAEGREHARAESVLLPAATTPADLAGALAAPIGHRLAIVTALHSRCLTIDVSLEPDPDGYLTLCLLPPADADPAALSETMREAAWATIEALLGRPLAERRTEPIALRLVGDDGRATTLDVGASVVIVRNQAVFTAWVGSDGRVMLKLFPPSGMPAR